MSRVIVVSTELACENGFDGLFDLATGSRSLPST